MRPFYNKTTQSQNINSNNLLSSSFILKLLVLLGYKPELNICTVCHKAITKFENNFDLTKGGLVCKNCVKSEDSFMISGNTIKTLRYIIHNNFEKIIKLKIENKIFLEVNKTITSFRQFIN